MTRLNLNHRDNVFSNLPAPPCTTLGISQLATPTCIRSSHSGFHKWGQQLRLYSNFLGSASYLHLLRPPSRSHILDHHRLPHSDLCAAIAIPLLCFKRQIQILLRWPLISCILRDGPLSPLFRENDLYPLYCREVDFYLTRPRGGSYVTTLSPLDFFWPRGPGSLFEVVVCRMHSFSWPFLLRDNCIFIASFGMLDPIMLHDRKPVFLAPLAPWIQWIYVYKPPRATLQRPLSPTLNLG